MEDIPNILGSLITAGASVITTLLGVWLGKMISNSSSSRSIRERQLLKLYTPLEICLNYSPEIGKSTIIDEAYKIVISNLELVHTQVLDELKSAQADISRIYHFKIVVSSYYNWTKRSLGYPFDKGAILSEFTPISKKLEKAYSIVSITALILWAFSACIIIEYFLFPAYGVHPVIFSSCCIFFSTGMGLYIQWLFQARRK